MIDVHDADGLRIVTINRPDKANSLTAAMLEDLAGVFEFEPHGPCPNFDRRGRKGVLCRR